MARSIYGHFTRIASRGLSRGLVRLAAFLGLILCMSCTQVIRNHGYIPLDEDLAQVEVGRSTRDSVAELVGRPTTSGVLRDTGWYYVGSRVRHYGYRAPQEIDRQVVAISFSQSGTVQNVERFGLERGQVVTLSRRVTDTGVQGSTFIRQIIRNFGRIDVGEALARDN